MVVNIFDLRILFLRQEELKHQTAYECTEHCAAQDAEFRIIEQFVTEGWVDAGRIVTEAGNEHADREPYTTKHADGGECFPRRIFRHLHNA